LHFKAQSSRERTYLIHGTLENARCGKECSNQLYSFPDFPIDKGEELTTAQIEQLKCEKCASFLLVKVNTELVLLYWNIGTKLNKYVLGNQRADYGKRL
jgi:NAD-dependent SIR2 family protein deacetylase